MRTTRLLTLAVTVALMLVAVAAVPRASAAEVCQQYHTVQAGENLYRISLRYGTTVAALQQLNNLSNTNVIYVGQQLCVAGSSYTPAPPPSNQPTYTVQRGDTLFSIAQRFGISMSALASANGITNPNMLYAGQVLVIPVAPGGPTNNDVVLPTPVMTLYALVQLNVRSGPGYNYAVEAQMRPGEMATVTGVSVDGQWWRISCVVDASGMCWVSANPSLTQAVGLPM